MATAAGWKTAGLAIAVAVVGCSCGEGVALDAGADGAMEERDAAPPQFCPDDLVRHVAFNAADGVEWGPLAMSLGAHDIALMGESGGGLRVHAIHRESGRFEELSDRFPELASVDAVSIDPGMLYFMKSEYFLQSETGIYRLHASDASGTVELGLDRAEVSSRQLAPLSGRELLALDIAEAPPTLEHWTWELGAAPARREVAALPGIVRSYGVRATRDGRGQAFLAVYDHGASEIVVFVLDEEVTRVVREHRFFAEDVAALVPDEAGVALVLETGRGVEVHRVSAEDASLWVRLPERYALQSVPGSPTDRSFFLLLTEGGLRGDVVMNLARVRLDRPELEGGFRPVLSSGSCRGTIAAPASGGAVVVSSCLDPGSLEYTYFCVPDVSREEL